MSPGSWTHRAAATSAWSTFCLERHQPDRLLRKDSKATPQPEAERTHSHLAGARPRLPLQPQNSTSVHARVLILHICTFFSN